MATLSQYSPRALPHSTLWTIDCSADLQRYHRDLGPGVQARSFERTNEALRVQLNAHRDFLLRQSMNMQNPLGGQLSGSIPTAAPVIDVKRRWSHTQQAAPTAPEPGQIHTYPPALRSALERCNAIPPANDGSMYQVVEEIRSNWMDDSHGVVGTYASVREANERVVHLFFDGPYNSGMDAGEEPEFEVLNGGRLRCAIQTDGSMGGYEEYYVQRVSLDGRGSARRR